MQNLDENIRKIGIFVADRSNLRYNLRIEFKKFPSFRSRINISVEKLFRRKRVVQVGRDDIIRELILYTILLHE